MIRISSPFLRRAAFGVLTAIALPGLAEAAAQHIGCPKDQIRREVTTPLPSGWWNTPIVNSLKSTHVITIGGRKALQCRYGGAGNIQRYAPDGMTCRSVTGGFVCQSPGVRVPETYSTKLLRIPQTHVADLDRGVVGGPRSAVDIWFQAESATRLYITPRNGARLSISGTRNRGYEGCRTARYSRHRVALRDVPEGTYVCLRTNAGRFSEFRVNDISGGYPKQLSIGYTTWE